MKISLRGRFWLTVVVLLVAGAVMAPVVRAQPTPNDPARAAFDLGLTALNAGRYGDAVLALEESERLRPLPLVQYNLGLAYRGAGRNLDAIACFERFLRDPGTIPEERITVVRRELDALRTRVAVLAVVLVPANATFSVDGRPRAFSASLSLDAGLHVFEASAEGYRSERRELTLQPGSRVPLELRLLRLPPRALPPTRLRVEPSEPGAEVTIDGTMVGFGAVTRTLAAGSHEVRVRAAGFVPFRRTVTVGTNEELRLPVLLQREVRDRGLLTRWWFWTGTAVVLGVAVTGLVVGLSSTQDPFPGTAFNVEALRLR